jgi:rubrerythrin
MKRYTRTSRGLLYSYVCPVCGERRTSEPDRECGVCARREAKDLRLFLKQHKNDTVEQLLASV